MEPEQDEMFDLKPSSTFPDSRLVQSFRSVLIFLRRSSGLRPRSTSDLEPVPQAGTANTGLSLRSRRES